MFDDFLIRAITAGLGIAIIAGPLGCLVVWRRMAFFGDSLAHAALLGIALALVIDISPDYGVPSATIAACGILLALRHKTKLSSDTMLSIIAHSTLALALVVIALVDSYEISVMALLMGDILAVSKQDLIVIYGGGTVVLGILIRHWHRLVAATISPEIATAEGMSPQKSEWVFMLLVALVVAIALKLIGALLITALMIIPAATARRLSATPEIMAVAAIIVGIISMGGGVYGSYTYDTPTGPTIILTATLLFALSFLVKQHGGSRKDKE